MRALGRVRWLLPAFAVPAAVDLGRGIRSWDGIPVGPLNRRRFLLAGCPRAFGARLATALLHDLPVSAAAVRDGRMPAFELRVGKTRFGLVVAARTLRPLEAVVGAGRSSLRPARAGAALREVRPAFSLGAPPWHHRA